MGHTYMAWARWEGERTREVIALVRALHERLMTGADPAEAGEVFQAEGPAARGAAEVVAREIGSLAKKAGTPCGLGAASARFNLPSLSGEALLVEHHEVEVFDRSLEDDVKRVVAALRALLEALSGEACGGFHLD